MKIIYKNIGSVVLENDRAYLNVLEAVLNSVDELCTLEINKEPKAYSFRVATSSPSYLTPIIESLNSLHNAFNIKVDFSKSIKSSSSIFYKITFS